MINDRYRAIRRAALIALLLMLALTAPALADADGTVTYRALLIGNSDYANNASISDLKSCAYDLANMNDALQSGSIRYDKVVARANLSYTGFSSAVNEVIQWGADDDDVTVFYYTGHGSSSGLLGVNYSNAYGDTYDFATLQSALSNVPGTVIVLLDSCYSGGLIAKGASAADFTDNAIAAFSSAGAAGITAKAIVSGTKFHVIASSAQTEQSYAATDKYGLATDALCAAIGWQHSGGSQSGNKLTSLEGDDNGDWIVTIGEAYAYAYDVVKNYQHMQIYPAGSAQTLIAREVPVAAAGETAKALVNTMNLEKACIAPGKTIQLDSGLSGSVSWTSSKESLATVDGNGLVTGVKYSYYTVATVMALSGSSYTTCQVRVLPDRYVVNSLRLKYSALTLEQGSAYTMPTRFSPASARYKNLRWKSDDPSIATVSSSGRITAVAKTGSTVITATATSGVTAQCTVSCIGALPKSVKLDKTKLTLLSGLATPDWYMLTEIVSPSIAEDKTVKWTSSNQNVATVNADGRVEAVSPGKAVITVRTVNGKKAACTVTVVKNQSIPRTRPKNRAGKLVSSARKIYYGTDGTLRVDMYFYNRTGTTYSVPAPNPGLVVLKLKGSSSVRYAKNTFTTKTLYSGRYLIYTFKFDTDEFPQFKNLDLRGSDAWYEADN